MIKKPIKFGTTTKIFGLVGSVVGIISFFNLDDIKISFIVVLSIVVLFLASILFEYKTNYKALNIDMNNTKTNNRVLEEQHIQYRNSNIELKQKLAIARRDNENLKNFIFATYNTNNTPKYFANYLIGGDQVVATMEDSKNN